MLKSSQFQRGPTGSVAQLPIRQMLFQWSERLPAPLRRYGLLGVGLLIPAWMLLTSQPSYLANVAVTVAVYMVLAMGLNIVVGLAGLLDLGYIAFFAVGAYTYAIGAPHGLSFWLALPVAALLAAGFGVLLGAPTLPLRGDYLAIVTLGFGEIIRISLNNLDWLTRGPAGISGVPAPVIPWIGPKGFTWLTLYQPLQLYFVALAFVAFVYWMTSRLKQSRVGRAWVAIREDEIAAAAMGIDTVKLKLLAFATGAALAGMVGVLFAVQLTYVSPDSFTLIESVMVVSMVVLGGMGSVPGVALGALILIVLPEALRGFSEYRLLLFGAAMILVMLIRPQGLLGERQGVPPRPTGAGLEDETPFEVEKRDLPV
ncbi:branched-chain amino acid ABC transporter permease [Gloeobacter morelensis MG652769]|uniref:Branched-chain amino acid ABC transporter permease n=2 Tax=Gloeobacter TaxID=33071 RepID=A0ABY3PS96_9CYAN|nr:branched-chain amino acid ABC transporter permease [Gloeobacter morelensis MG652769]